MRTEEQKAEEQKAEGRSQKALLTTGWEILTDNKET